jgi:hypothetical protein
MAFKMKGMEFGEGTGSPNKFLDGLVKGVGKALKDPKVKQALGGIAGGIIGGPAGAQLGSKLAGGMGKKNDGEENVKNENAENTEETTDPNAVSEEEIAQAKQKMKQNREGGSVEETASGDNIMPLSY